MERVQLAHEFDDVRRLHELEAVERADDRREQRLAAAGQAVYEGYRLRDVRLAHTGRAARLKAVVPTKHSTLHQRGDSGRSCMPTDRPTNTRRRPSNSLRCRSARAASASRTASRTSAVDAAQSRPPGETARLLLAAPFARQGDRLRASGQRARARLQPVAFPPRAGITQGTSHMGRRVELTGPAPWQ